MPINYEDLVAGLVKSLEQHKSTEVRDTSEDDKILIGLLNLLNEIFDVRSELRAIFGNREGHNLVNMVFSNCLFNLKERSNTFPDYTKNLDILAVVGRDYVKTKCRNSREAAMQLLKTLCEDNPVNLLTLLQDGLLPLINLIPKIEKFGYYPSTRSKSQYGYSGIYNLGCICYMIAML